MSLRRIASAVLLRSLLCASLILAACQQRKPPSPSELPASTPTPPAEPLTTQSLAGSPPPASVAQVEAKVAPVDGSPIWGDPGAPVTVMVFMSLGCSHCQVTHAADGNLGRLRDEFGPRRLRVVYKHAPFEIPAVELAHRATAAAHEQGAFWAYHDALLARLNPVGEEEALDREALLTLAREQGLDVERFARDLDGAVSADRIHRDRALLERLLAARPEGGGEGLDVSGTPSYLVNGAALDNSHQALRAAVEAELGAWSAFTQHAPAENFYASRVEVNTRHLVFSPPGTTSTPTSTSGVQPPSISLRDPMIGSPEALVPVLVFSDLRSAECQTMVQVTRTLYEAHPRDVLVVAFPTPLDDDGHLRAQAALAMHDQARFWTFQALLLAQPEALSEAAIGGLVTSAGGDPGAVMAALDAFAFRSDVNRSVSVAGSLGIESLPTVFVGGQRFVGVHTLEALEAAFATQRALAETLRDDGLNPRDRLRGLFEAAQP